MNLVSWNVGGQSQYIPTIVDDLTPDILAVQDLRSHPNALPFTVRHLRGYSATWATSESETQNSVGVYSHLKSKAVQLGMGAVQYDVEGRVIVSQYPAFTLINVLVPAGTQSRAAWFYKLSFLHHLLAYVAVLQADGHHVIVCGDFRIAHHPIDVARPLRVAGYMAEERDWITEFLELGFVDAFRHVYPDRIAYTWWGHKNHKAGWRVDYIFVSTDLLTTLQTVTIHDDLRLSDHAPISIELSLA